MTILRTQSSEISPGLTLSQSDYQSGLTEISISLEDKTLLSVVSRQDRTGKWCVYTRAGTIPTLRTRVKKLAIDHALQYAQFVQAGGSPLTWAPTPKVGS